MEILFVHPNFPGQFRHFAAALAREPGIRVSGIGDEKWMKDTIPLTDIPVIAYPSPTTASHDTHVYARSFESAVRRGQQVVQTLLTHKRQGLEPDLIIAHPGWGDAFYLKDIFPGTPVIGLFEYYYRTRGADVGFDPEFPMNFDDIFRIHSLNATQLLALESCDAGYCPTAWQHSCFPAHHQMRLNIIHDGIDTNTVAPDTKATITLPDGSIHQTGEEILTFVSRGLEPYRGFHVFMRALPRILKARPHCQVIIVGSDQVSYGKQPAPGQTYRQRYLDEIADQVDQTRIHFSGRLPYHDYLKVLQVSRLHTYMTYPFILSWSMLEAMSAGCLVLASATPPVQEVIMDGENGLLTPFGEPSTLASRAISILADPEQYQHIRHAARQTIVTRYDFNTVSYPAFRQFLKQFEW
ncbi:Glycosyltransferase involved in cell wall bisynthesis [Nitrosomonas cryotolerans]|uniref:Glycosyltransferase involved in cell wall bisynthesis n=1 Tax=Nitrosomonas cryotolerans ATCC 49181 TaxID=1131553 RepID=A0A1N6JFR6_9PROT|nr:glycosyltransferase family 4 protein [Nitrosomonas cryotolerans]SFP66780.1 Glycosyltransferase involved in cell wall bisynthesis [Nitrosomonas cryotolerans]SIO42946.1 Glycosyltransferase involved in cell wall bisynthesis [Nitrosomonas cryotolerans ATCC 49181]